ncbi:MAG: TIGR00725 family protein [Deltaproteobacteria bacterium]|nr:TIGR00725 family protein [Deltaproteobacteria bacterium]
MSIQIGVIGAGQCSLEIERLAEEVGREIAKKKALLICGGLGGVMEASARGAKQEGGVTIGILPGFSFEDANPFIDIPIVTGLSHARNVLVVRSSQAINAVEGGYGTLSEIGIALKLRKPVVGLRTWDVSKKIVTVETPEDAVKKAISLIKKTS